MEISALQKARLVALINEEIENPRLPFTTRDREGLLAFGAALMLDKVSLKA